MSLNQQSLFRLGVGHGFNAGSRLGIWPEVESVVQSPPPRAQFGIKRVADKPLKFSILLRGAAPAGFVLHAEHPFSIRVKGTTRAGVSAVSERLTDLLAAGQSKAGIETHTETVFSIAAGGAVTGHIDVRHESSPVFSDDELMALAAWQYLH